MRDKNTKTFLFLFTVTSILFISVGVIMIIVDRRYILGLQYLFTAILSIIAIKKTKAKELNFKHYNKNQLSINLGFIFSVIGVNINIGIWGLGTLLFIDGLSKNKLIKKFYKK